MSYKSGNAIITAKEDKLNIDFFVEENLNNKLFKNMRKFVKKFFNKKERLLILQNNESYKSK